MLTRVFLLIATNIVIITTVSIAARLLGLDSYVTETGLDYQALAVFCLLWGFVGAFISLQISRWMAKKLLGVRLLEAGRAGEHEWLVAAVHGAAKRAGLSAMPEVGIYESEDENAFATGPSRSRSLVAFSTALLSAMSRDAVEGVVAHEIAHIQNGDMVTMTIIQGVVNAFVMFVARVIAWAASQAVDEKLSGVVWYVTVLVLQIVLGLLAMLVTCWFSRRREYAADAGSARIAGAGKMIAALEALQSLSGKQEAAGMPASMAAFGISGRSGGLLALWRTHPELERRIAALKALK